MDREIYAKAGANGFVGFNIPESHGGGGSDDFWFNTIVNEELQYAGMGGAGNGMTLVNDILAPYFTELCNDEQKDRWLPGLASGELISAVAMTEPGTGSDLASIATRAVARTNMPGFRRRWGSSTCTRTTAVRVVRCTSGSIRVTVPSRVSPGRASAVSRTVCP